MNDDLPPPNRGIIWYRVMLWLMPTCIAGTTAIAGTLLGFSGELPLIIWTLLNVASIFGVGVFEAKLKSRPNRVETFNTDLGVIRFFLLQLLIIPSLSIALVVAWWIASAVLAIAL